MSDEVTAKESAAKIRLREEIQGVKTKSQRLLEFCNGEIFITKLNAKEKRLLVKQQKIMLKYIQILEERLAIWRDV